MMITDKAIKLLTDDKLQYQFSVYSRAYDRQLILQRHGLEQATIFKSVKLTYILLREEMLRRDLVYNQ